MKKTIFSRTLLCLVMVFILATSCLVVGEIANVKLSASANVGSYDGGLIKNGDFALEIAEDTSATYATKSYDNWSSFAWADRVAEAGVDGNLGMAHFVYNMADFSTGFPTLYQDVAVETNTTYELKFSLKNWNAEVYPNQAFYAGYRDMTAVDTYANVSDTCITDSTAEYKEYTFTFNSGNLTEVRIAFFVVGGQNAPGGFHMDNVSLTKKEVNAFDSGLIANGDFALEIAEDTSATYATKSYDNWSSFAWADRVAEAGIDGNLGMAHFVYNMADFSTGFATLYQDVVVEANTAYELKFHLKNWNAEAYPNQAFYAGYRDMTAADTYVNVSDICITDATAEYKEYTFTFNSGSLTEVRIAFFVVGGQNAPGGFHMDNVSLTKAEQEPTPSHDSGLLVNGDFAEAIAEDTAATYAEKSLNGWSSFAWADRVNEAGIDGALGMGHFVYNMPDVSTGFPTIYQDVAVEANTNYVLKFFLKNWNAAVYPNQAFYAGYRDLTAADIYANVSDVMITDATAEFKEYTFSFNSGELTEVRIAFFVVGAQNPAGGFHLDNVSLTKAEQEPTPDPSHDSGLLGNGDFAEAIAENTLDTYLTEKSLGNWSSFPWADRVNEAGIDGALGMGHFVYCLEGEEIGYATMYQDVAVEPNTTYNLKFWLKNWNAVAYPNQAIYVGYRDMTAADPYLNVKDTCITDATAEFKEYTFTFNSGALTEVRIAFFVVGAQNPAGGFHMDNVSLTKGEQVVVPEHDSGLLGNGDFSQLFVSEESTTYETEKTYGNWTSWPWADRLAEVGMDEKLGMGHLVYRVPAADTGYATFWQDVEVEANTWYVLTFYAKNWNAAAYPNQAIYVGYRDITSQTPYDNVDGGLVVRGIPADWTKVEYVFNTKDLTEIRIAFFISGGMGDPAGGFHMDNVSLVKAENLANEWKVELADSQSNYGDAIKLSAVARFGEVEYLFATSADGEFTANVPTEVGTYYVKATVQATGGYTALESEMKQLVIVQATNAWEQELSCEDIRIGNAITPVAVAKFGEVKFTYSATEDGEFSETLPSQLGTYYVKAEVVGTDNYTGLSAIISFDIIENPTFTITFDSNGGSAVDSIIEQAGVAIEVPTPIKAGYVFNGWMNGETKYDLETMPAETVTLVASWSINVEAFEELVENASVAGTIEDKYSAIKGVELLLSIWTADEKATLEEEVLAKYDTAKQQYLALANGAQADLAKAETAGNKLISLVVAVVSALAVAIIIIKRSVM